MSFTKSKYLKFAILIISICFLIGVVSACLPLNLSLPELNNEAISDTAMVITQNSSDGLGEFNDGYSYVYTDKDKIDAFRAGDEDTPYDISVVKVDKTKNARGTQGNPYVISTIDDWKKLSQNLESGVIASYGSGAYFVLANDIDFDGETCYPVRFFNGTFYGLGHTLKNVTISSWQYISSTGTPTAIGNTTISFGLFCNTKEATITDLALENYNYSGIAQTSAIASGVSRVSYTGGIVGLISGSDAILNCHSQGSISSTTSFSTWAPFGGVIGGFYSFKVAGKTPIAYRCSAYLELTASGGSQTPIAGGLWGDAYNGAISATTYIYDCVSYLKHYTSSGMIYTSGVFGHATTNGVNYIENSIGYLDVIGSGKINDGTLMGSYTNGTRYMKNCYALGMIGASDSSKLSLYAAGGNVKVASASNINIVKSSSTYAPFYTSSYSDSLSNIAGEPNDTYTTLSSLIAKATNDIGTYLPSGIWDAKKTSDLTTYWSASYNGEDTIVKYSPVRNYLLAFVDFRNVINGGKNIDNDVESVNIVDGDPYIVGDALPTADSDSAEFSEFLKYLNGKATTMHEFVGWTDDPSGDGDVFTELPSGMFGPVTLYAVWTLPDDYMNTHTVTTSLTVDKDEITYDTKASITLTGKLTYSFDVMTDPTETYYFTQDGDKKATSTTGTLTVKTVPDSGTYTYTYRIKDGYEPLWMYDGKSTDSQTITINKGIISVDTFKVTNDAYYGMPVKDVEFTITAKNSADVSVSVASAVWKNTLESNVVDKQGANTKTVRLVPVDKVNYGDYVDLDVTFDSETLYLTFYFPQIVEPLYAELEYSQNYSAKQIIYLFNTKYLEALDSNPAFSDLANNGMAPYLSDEEDINKGAPIVADSSGKALYSSAFDDVREEFTIYVYLMTVKYTITFDANSSNNTTPVPEPEEYGYGKYVKQPEDPTNGDYLFVGWYFTDTDGKERAWRFSNVTDADGNDIPEDRVTGNLTLTAVWLSATDLDSVDLVISPTATFTTLETLTDGDSRLTVTGNYSGTHQDGAKATASKVIPSGYTIQYGILDEGGEFVDKYTTLKVVEDGGMYIRVGVKFGNTTVYSAPQPIRVDPKDITDVTKEFSFGDTDGTVVYDYDGSVKKLPELSISEVKTITQGQIIGVNYEYRDAYTNEIVENPTEIGTYIVTVSYTTASADFYAKPTVITMKIASTIKVKVEWDTTSLMYTGAEQHPVVAKVYNAETGAEIIVNSNNITYTGDTDAVKINMTPYKVKVSLGDMYSVVEGEECSFNITKALLKIPTYTSGMIMYDGTTKVLEEYLGEQFNPLLMKIADGGTGRDVNTYRATITLTDTINCSWEDNTFGSKVIEWKIEPAILYVSWDEWEFVDDGVSAYAPKISKLIGLVGSDEFDYDNDFIYKIYDEDGNLLDVSEVDEIGSYKITASFNGTVKNYTLDSTTKEWSFVVVPKSGMTILTIEWSETSFLYDGEIHYPKPTIKDANGNDVTADVMAYLKFSEGYNTHRDIGTYSVKVTIKDSAADEYFIRTGSTCKFMITDENGYAPDEDETNAGKKDDDEKGGAGSLELGNIVQYWPLVVSIISIILIIIFLSKASKYNSERKKFNKKSEKLERVYAGLFTGTLFGMSMTIWAAIAFTLAGLAVVSFIIMLLCKRRCNAAEEEYEEALDEFNRNKNDFAEQRKQEEYNRREEENRRREEEARRRDEDMKMMFMNMFGGAAAQGMAPNMAGADGQGMPAGGYANMQPSLGAAEIRGIVSETMTAMLPGVQQMLPAQASVSDEVIKTLTEVVKDNKEELRRTDEKIQRIIDKSDERFAMMMKTQEALINKLLEREVAPQVVAPQIVEKEVVKEVPVEKIVEKEVVKEVPIEVEKIVEKEVKVEVPVEKIVEKEVVKEVPVEVEKIVEVPVEVVKEVPIKVEVPVEKIVEKEVRVEVPVEVIKEVPVKSEPRPKKEVAPRLTLDEAYALLTKEQKKFFDGLKQYVLDKYKCKEKKTTYFVTYGQTSTNPLLKLMIKKNITVAMLKMEDELMKDIRRDATGDGTKVKVKETEILVTDAQAFDTAKKMIDLRYDQIERYADLLKEQRSLRR